MAALDYVLDLMGFEPRFGRPPRLYVKALVLKEVCKASLRYAESLSQTHRPKHHSIKGYTPIVNRCYGARISERAYDESLYAYRGVGEGIFGTLTVEFGERLKTRGKEPNKDKNTSKDYNILP
jgi:hypothetical protein